MEIEFGSYLQDKRIFQFYNELNYKIWKAEECWEVSPGDHVPLLYEKDGKKTNFRNEAGKILNYWMCPPKHNHNEYFQYVLRGTKLFSFCCTWGLIKKIYFHLKQIDSGKFMIILFPNSTVVLFLKYNKRKTRQQFPHIYTSSSNFTQQKYSA